MKISLPGSIRHNDCLMVLVTGGRTFKDDYAVFDALDQVDTLCDAHNPPLRLIVLQGGALGADRIARDWVRLNHDLSGVTGITEVAQWGTYGRAAGPRRNQAMIDKHQPDLCLAFPGGNGTADMVRRCRCAGIPVFQHIEGADDVG